jgi:hypothetical protein
MAAGWMLGRLVDGTKLAYVLPPVSANQTAKNSLWVLMKEYKRVAFVLGTYTGATATDTPAVGLQQAQDSSGTGAKTLETDYYWSTAAQSQTGATDAVTTNAIGSPGVAFSLPAPATNANCLYVMDVYDAQLDINNGFNNVRMTIAASANGTVNVFALAVAYAGLWAGKPDTMPSVMP